MFKSKLLYKTPHIKPADMKTSYLIVDASSDTIGRLGSRIAKILMGKNKSHYMPNALCGDCVIVINSDKVKMSGTKMVDHSYYKHTGYPGGIKRTNPKTLLDSNKSDRIIRFTVKNMLPSGPLGRKMLSRLKIFRDENHHFAPQKPVNADIGRGFRIKRVNN